MSKKVQKTSDLDDPRFAEDHAELLSLERRIVAEINIIEDLTAAQEAKESSVRSLVSEAAKAVKEFSDRTKELERRHEALHMLRAEMNELLNKHGAELKGQRTEN